MTPWPRRAKSMRQKSLMPKAEGSDPVQAELLADPFLPQTACGILRAAALQPH